MPYLLKGLICDNEDVVALVGLVNQKYLRLLLSHLVFDEESEFLGNSIFILKVGIEEGNNLRSGITERLGSK